MLRNHYTAETVREPDVKREKLKVYWIWVIKKKKKETKEIRNTKSLIL